MRKVLLCVPMMTLLLSACAVGPAKVSPAEELALAIRGEYLESTAWTAQVEITADYGQRVYQYSLTASSDGEETVLTLTAPETVEGITARLTKQDGVLEYDGLSVETGPLDENGLTPVSALPVLMETARSGYMTACSLEDRVLRIDCGDPEGTLGEGREVSLWFDADTHALTQSEIRVDGFRVVACDYLSFTKE